MQDSTATSAQQPLTDINLLPTKCGNISAPPQQVKEGCSTCGLLPNQEHVATVNGICQTDGLVVMLDQEQQTLHGYSLLPS